MAAQILQGTLDLMIIANAGLKALAEETARSRQMAGVVEKLLAEEQ